MFLFFRGLGSPKSELLGVALGSFGPPWASLGPLLALLWVPLGPLAPLLGLTWASFALPVDSLGSSWPPFGFSRPLLGLPWIKNGAKKYEKTMKNETPLDLARGGGKIHSGSCQGGCQDPLGSWWILTWAVSRSTWILPGGCQDPLRWGSPGGSCPHTLTICV